jgi:ABC-2 type transport system ATP-binding protein
MPNVGEVTIGGKRYHDFTSPLREVGALLEAKALHPGRKAYYHLLALAQSNGLPAKRVDEVLGIVGLETVAKRRAGGFSLGMGQRLGIAAALLGDPGVLMFDEPVNGLDPEGILWVRNLMRALSAEGRTVFVSSHLMSEMSLTADHLIVIGRGQLIADASVSEFLDANAKHLVRVRSPQREELVAKLGQAGAKAAPSTDGTILGSGMDAAGVGELAAASGLILHELTPQRASLEEAFMELTRDSVEFHAAGSPGWPTEENGSVAGATTPSEVAP